MLWKPEETHTMGHSFDKLVFPEFLLHIKPHTQRGPRHTPSLHSRAFQRENLIPRPHTKFKTRAGAKVAEKRHLPQPRGSGQAPRGSDIADLGNPSGCEGQVPHLKRPTVMFPLEDSGTLLFQLKIKPQVARCVQDKNPFSTQGFLLAEGAAGSLEKVIEDS